jgi:hypothetical protein
LSKLALKLSLARVPPLVPLTRIQALSPLTFCRPT